MLKKSYIIDPMKMVEKWLQDIIGAMDTEVSKLADAQDKLDAVQKLLHPTRSTLTE